MHSTRVYLLILVVFVVLPVAVGTRRSLARARRGGVPADRNPGPEGGYILLSWALRRLPAWFMRVAMQVGTTVGYWTLPCQRAHSREYLRLVRGARADARRAPGAFLRVRGVPRPAPANLRRARAAAAFRGGAGGRTPRVDRLGQTRTLRHDARGPLRPRGIFPGRLRRTRPHDPQAGRQFRGHRGSGAPVRQERDFSSGSTIGAGWSSP